MSNTTAADKRWDVSEFDSSRVHLDVTIAEGFKPLHISYNPLGLTLEAFSKLSFIGDDKEGGFDAKAVAEQLVMVDLDWELYSGEEKVECTVERLLDTRVTIVMAIWSAIRENEDPKSKKSPSSNDS